MDQKGINRRKFIGSAAALGAFFIVPRHVLGGVGFLAPSDTITLGFIGTGRQGLNLQRSFLNTGGTRIIAACDVYKSKLENFAAVTNNFYAKNTPKLNSRDCTRYLNFMDMLARPDMDAVVIATPDHWHAAMAVRAAAAGKDIYSEKPLSLTIAEGRAMVNAVRKHKRIFQTGSMQRSMPEFRQCVELIRNGYIGNIRNVKVSIGGPPVKYNLPIEPVPSELNWDMWLGPNEYFHYNKMLNPPLGETAWAKWRDYKGLGGGDMTDWGAHMFDIVQWALEKDSSGPTEVIAPGAAGNKFLTYKYPGNIDVIHEDFGKKHAIQFNGTEGTIEIQRGKLSVPDNLSNKVIGGTDKRVYFSDNHHSDFINAIKTRRMPIADVETGHRSATVCNIGNIAYETGKSLKWNPVTELFNDAAANKFLTRKMKKEWEV